MVHQPHSSCKTRHTSTVFQGRVTSIHLLLGIQRVPSVLIRAAENICPQSIQIESHMGSRKLQQVPHHWPAGEHRQQWRSAALDHTYSTSCSWGDCGSLAKHLQWRACPEKLRWSRHARNTSYTHTRSSSADLTAVLEFESHLWAN